MGRNPGQHPSDGRGIGAVPADQAVCLENPDIAGDPSTFSKYRDRLLDGDFAAAFLDEAPNTQKVKALLSSEHFSVDGTLIQSWASMKSFRRKDGKDQPPSPGRNGERDFHNDKPGNQTHASTTDPDARLYHKGRCKEAKLSFVGHLLMENRNGLVVDARLTRASGRAETKAALAMLRDRAAGRRITVGADKAYDTSGFVAAARAMKVTPHVARKINARRGSNIDSRATRHPGYAISQVSRKRIEEANGWVKTVAGMDSARLRGTPRMGWMFTFLSAAYNLVRQPRLLPTG